jgi:putative transposase
VLKVRSQLPRVGTRKLHHMLADRMRELGVGRDKLFAILRANHLCVEPRRSYRTTTNSHHQFRKHKNLIMGMPLVRPEQVWASDITYVGGREKHSYLSLVTDAYSKKVVGYDLSDNLGVEGTLRALRMAVKQRLYHDEPLIHHSDRGVQYCCDAYQRLLEKKRIACSMTEAYDPYANAVAERVNGILKGEFQLEQYNADLETMKRLVGNSVHLYNTMRPHHSCHMLTPEQMHHQRKVKIKTYKKTEGIKASLDTFR